MLSLLSSSAAVLCGLFSHCHGFQPETAKGSGSPSNLFSVSGQNSGFLWTADVLIRASVRGGIMACMVPPPGVSTRRGVGVLPVVLGFQGRTPKHRSVSATTAPTWEFKKSGKSRE
ncbi:unnamed protein product [Periconia digitata]|uniref:Secreted protein n=1 Tax=Periconia digitata TaxID=1303443 RepID=A0A9W4UDM8_9PLEO|nr:unnamed protein product [Periconia digitata]